MTTIVNGPYAHLSRAELEARLAAAEDVCLLFSWSPTSAGAGESDREKAAFEVWQVWWDHPGVRDFERASRPAWPDSRIAELARQRDRTRAETLAAIDRLIRPEGTDTP